MLADRMKSITARAERAERAAIPQTRNSGSRASRSCMKQLVRPRCRKLAMLKEELLDEQSAFWCGQPRVSCVS